MDRKSGVRVRSIAVMVMAWVLAVFMYGCLPIRSVYITGRSMEPTIHDGTYMLRVLESQIDRGDIVVLVPPKWYESKSERWVKRVIGLPGDTVELTREGHVLVNGRVLFEPYLLEQHVQYDPVRVTLGPDEFWVMGDNRAYAADSRHIGKVNRTQIQEVFSNWFVVW